MDPSTQDFNYFPSNMTEAHKIIGVLKNTAKTYQNALIELKNKFKLLEEEKCTLQMVILLQDVKEVNNQAATKACDLSQEVDVNKHNYEQDLEKYVIKYDELSENLTKQGISIQNQKFRNLLDQFIKLLRENDTRRENAFNIATEIEEICKNKVEGIQQFICRSINEMKLLIEKENNRLIEFKKISFLNDFTVEQKQYQDLLDVVNKETAFLKNLLDMGVVSTSKIPNTPTNEDVDDEDTELLSNNLNLEQSTKIWRSKSFDNLINKNLSQTENKEDNSVILLNFPEFGSDKKDVFEVMFFLMNKLNIKDIDITISRSGDQQDNIIRPVVVTLSNESIYNDILNQANEKHLYEGTNIEIRKYDQF